MTQTKTIFNKVNYLRQGESLNYDHEIYLPEPLASWDVFDYWEVERVRSMEANLDKSDILFDVGAEHGWMSVVFAKFCQVFLIEPTKEFWPNIYQTWCKNRAEQPVGTFQGLLGAKSDNGVVLESLWPLATHGELIDKNKYEYLHQHDNSIKTLSLDDLVKLSKVTPTALCIDVEGGELEVLKGSKKTLSKNSLKVWVSIHPDLLKRDYSGKVDDIHKFMKSLGYTGKHIATDHEEHWYYTKKK